MIWNACLRVHVVCAQQLGEQSCEARASERADYAVTLSAGAIPGREATGGNGSGQSSSLSFSSAHFGGGRRVIASK